MTRSLRRWTTWLCLAGFLFAQGVIAAYACPLQASADGRGSQASQPAEPQCPDHAGQVPAEEAPVCVAHCQGQSGAPGGNAAPIVPPFAMAPFPAIVEAGALLPPRMAIVARTPLEAFGGAPPLAQLCRLLI